MSQPIDRFTVADFETGINAWDAARIDLVVHTFDAPEPLYFPRVIAELHENEDWVIIDRPLPGGAIMIPKSAIRAILFQPVGHILDDIDEHVGLDEDDDDDDN